LERWWRFRARALHWINQLVPGRPCIEYLGFVSFKAKIEGFRKNIHVRRGARVREGAWLNCMDKNASIEIGERTLIMPYAKLMATEGAITIGQNSSVHSFDVLYGYSGGLRIGNNVRMGVNVSLIAGNHGFDDPTRSPNEQEGTSKGIVVHDNVWIGAGAIILDGVEVGEGAVIGAGSVVTHSVPPNAVCMGVPAKVVRLRGEVRGPQNA
jgi:acetyltransferase-like isoleucine patch superfamily enzyme